MNSCYLISGVNPWNRFVWHPKVQIPFRTKCFPLPNEGGVLRIEEALIPGTPTGDRACLGAASDVPERHREERHPIALGSRLAGLETSP
ncbi:MAG: hypothetical protein AAFR78_05500, partial [Planctomycetota bacterium]